MKCRAITISCSLVRLLRSAGVIPQTSQTMFIICSFVIFFIFRNKFPIFEVRSSKGERGDPEGLPCFFI